MTKNKIAKHEIMNFFQKMYQRLNGFADLKEISSSFIKTAILSVSLILIGIFLIIYGQFLIQNQWLLYSGVVIVLSGLIYAKCGRNKCLKYKNDALRRTRERILEYLRTHGSAFEKKNIKWRLPNTNFDWIELEVESKDDDDLETGHNQPAKYTEGDQTEHTMITMEDTAFNHVV